MKTNKIFYWIATAIMCLIFLFSAGMYFLNHDQVVVFFENFGFPTWLIYPLATAKILGIAAILSRKSKLLKEWAYAGFFFDGLLAFSAHQMAGDGQGGMAAVIIAATLISRFYDDKAFR